MRYLLPLTMLIMVSFSLFGQEETFRKYYGLPYDWAQEDGFSIEQTGEDAFVLIGTRENAESRSTDIAFWTFGPTGGFLDSSVWAFPQDQQILETFGGPDGGFLVAYYAIDAFERDTVNLAYFNPDGTLSWNQPLVDYDDLRDGIRGLDFISSTEVVLVYASSGTFPETAPKVAKVSATEGLTPLFTYRNIDFSEIWSLERQADGNLLMAGESGRGVFVTLVTPTGEAVWEEAFEQTLGNINPQRYDFLSSAHRPVGDTVILVTGMREQERAIIVMDTLGNRLEEYVVEEMTTVEREERAYWYGKTKLFINNQVLFGNYFQLIDLVDYEPTQNYAEGDGSFDGLSLMGSYYLADQDVVLSALDAFGDQAFSRFDNSNTTIEVIRGGTPSYNSNERALGIAVLPDSKLLLQTYSPFTPNINATNFWTVDSLGTILSEERLTVRPTSIVSAKDGNFLVHYFEFRRMVVQKVDATGDEIWQAEIRSELTGSEFSTVTDLGQGAFAWSETDIAFGDFGGYYRTRIVHSDSTGAELNSFFTNRTGEILSMAEDGAGHLIIAGSSYSFDSSLVVSYDLATGTENWRHAYQVPDFSYGGTSRLLPLADGSVGALNVVNRPVNQSDREVQLDFITLDAAGTETGRVSLENGPLQFFGAQQAQKANGMVTVVYGYKAMGDEEPQLLRIKEVDPATMTVSNTFELSSPHGKTTPAGIAFPDAERTAVVATASGSDTSFSNDVLLLIFDAEGNITDIRGQQTLPLEITLSPNPTPDVLRISTSGTAITGHLGLQLFDVTGRQLLRKEFDATNQAELDLSSFTAGSYFVLVRDERGRSITRKVIKL